jgi:hypothetical protein
MHFRKEQVIVVRACESNSSFVLLIVANTFLLPLKDLDSAAVNAAMKK